nr:hypothetical protein [uncultured Faecalimonas sp.]
MEKIYGNKKMKVIRTLAGYVLVKRKVSCLFCTREEIHMRKFYTAETVTEGKGILLF